MSFLVRSRSLLLATLASFVLAHRSAAEPQGLSPDVKAFVSVEAPVLVLKGVRVLDGSGAPARSDQSIVIRDGLIAAAGDAAKTPIPPGARMIELPGRTVLPGYVMLHEHLFYPVRHPRSDVSPPGHPAAIYGEMELSFPRLYLAGGTTTARTGGCIAPYVDLNLKKAIDEGRVPGPRLFLTAPYLEGPGLPIHSVKALENADDARRMVAYWAAEGFTSFKAYTDITRAELAAAVEETHRRGLKVTGHLCSVSFHEAAALGIDGLEHGLVVASDFTKGKKDDACPPGREMSAALDALDVNGPEVKALIGELVARKVALTSTLAIFETFVPGRPPLDTRVLETLHADAREQYLLGRARVAEDKTAAAWADRLRKEMAFERAFVAAGGLLVAGTDPTGYGGVVAGFGSQREIELLVEAGFPVAEAVQIATENGARHLGIEKETGTIAVGKRADLVIVKGDPSARIADIRNVETVFKGGVGFDSEKLVASVKGQAGWR